MTTRYWIGVASKEHVQRGLQDNFCALCHGKAAPLRRMQEGDWLLYYSNRDRYADKKPYQQFTAIGQVGPLDLQERDMGGFKLLQRPITYLEGLRDAPIKPLLEELSFVTDPKRWGFRLRFGHFEVTKEYFELIKNAMEQK